MVIGWASIFILFLVLYDVNSAERHSRVLIRGGGARDLPVVNYSCIRGVFDFEPLKKRKRRSIYGYSKPSELKTHIRRKYRDLFN